MPRWLPKILSRIRELAAGRRILMTLKARCELAELDIGLDEEDMADVLQRLVGEDYAGRLLPCATGERMYLFKPVLAGITVYLKVILRGDCIVVSFHEDEGDTHEDEGT